MAVAGPTNLSHLVTKLAQSSWIYRRGLPAVLAAACTEMYENTLSNCWIESAVLHSACYCLGGKVLATFWFVM